MLTNFGQRNGRYPTVCSTVLTFASMYVSCSLQVQYECATGDDDMLKDVITDDDIPNDVITVTDK